MKHILLFLFSITILLLATPDARAGFIMKKNAAAETTVVTSTATAAQKAGQLHAPIDNWTERGWIGTLSLIFGVLGFVAPLFGFAALLLGALGLHGKHNRHKATAIAGFVLGIIVVLLVIFGGFTGWGIS